VSDHGIPTTHVGNLPRPAELIDVGYHLIEGEEYDAEAYRALVREATAQVVRRQAAAGITIRNDGEFGHTVGVPTDYGAWWHYAFRRLAGFGGWSDLASLPSAPPKQGVRLSSFARRRDTERFPDVYATVVAAEGSGMKSSKDEVAGGFGIPVVTAELRYTGHEEIGRDVANLKAALEASGAASGFMCAIGPGSLSRIGNAHYESDEEFVWACAEAMREEYKAITGAGLIVQIDEPSFAENWDQFNPAPTLDEYEAFTMIRIEALNHALRDIPRELVRFHCCWGSWHGPHTTDMEMKNLVGMLLRIDAGSYSFEAANARHEHEWEAWEGVKLPDGVKLAPGVVTHSTNIVEHPELVAQRIERFARVVGPENVIASTDCGMGGRLHPDIAWAKLDALGEGARLASGRPLTRA